MAYTALKYRKKKKKAGGYKKPKQAGRDQQQQATTAAYRPPQQGGKQGSGGRLEIRPKGPGSDRTFTEPPASTQGYRETGVPRPPPYQPSPQPPPPEFDFNDPSTYPGNPSTGPGNPGSPYGKNQAGIPYVPLGDLNADSFNSPGRQSVGPSGGNLTSAVVGGYGPTGNYVDFRNMGPFLDSEGTGDPFHQARKYANWMLTPEGAGGVVGSTQEHLGALGDARSRYGAARNDISFDDWFGGQVGQGVRDRAQGQGFGWRNQDGSDRSVLQSDEFAGFRYANALANQDPDLQMSAYNQAGMQGMGRQAQNSTYGAAQGIGQGLMGGAGQLGQGLMGQAGGFGQGLVGGVSGAAQGMNMGAGGLAGSLGSQMGQLSSNLSQNTAGLNNRYEGDLMRAIDMEAQIGIEGGLDDVSARMEAAGLGRSGARQGASAEMYRGFMDQSNRDKMRALSGFAETGRGMEANALNIGAQGEMGALGQGFQGRLGALMQGNQNISQAMGQGYQGSMGAAGQAYQGSMGALGQAGQGQYNALGQDSSQMSQSIMGAMGLQGQGLGAAQQRYMGDQQNMSQMMLGLGGLKQQGLMNQNNAALAGFGQYSDMYNMRQGDQTNRMNQMLGLSEQNRLLEQQALNQQISTAFMPVDLMTTLSAGTTSPSYRPQQQSNPWANAGAQALGNVGQAGLMRAMELYGPQAVPPGRGPNP